MEYQTVIPPKEVFKYPPTVSSDVKFEDRVKSEQNVSYILEKLEVTETDGLLLHIQNAEYPKRGFPFPEAIAHINTIKRLLVVASKVINPLSLFFINKNKAIEGFNEVALYNIKPYILKTEYLTPVAKEIQKIVSGFAQAIHIKQATAEQFGEIIATMIEYDDAYRYRIQDIMSLCSKSNLLENPRHELHRLLGIMFWRDSSSMVQKFEKMMAILRIPYFNSRLKKVLHNINLEALKLDDIDRYWVMNRSDYRFLGLPLEERQKMMKSKPMGVKLNG